MAPASRWSRIARRLPGIPIIAAVRLLSAATLIVILVRPSPAQEFAPRIEPSWPESLFGFFDLGPEPGEGGEAESIEEENLDFIETDRNSLTGAPLVTGRGVGIMEVAYSYLNFPSEGVKHSFPESLFRFGISRRIELRVGWNYETGNPEEFEEGNIAARFGVNAETQIYYGTKIQLTAQEGLRPRSALLLQGHTPTGGPTTATQIRAGLISGWELPNDWTFDWAVRFAPDGEEGDGYELWIPSAVIKFPFAENRFFTHLEFFGLYSANKEQNISSNFLDTGLHYLITPDLEIGTIIGMQLQENPGYFVNVGLGFRF
ncbi:transporter [Tautonia rosea]|uniref:transporter n=1 Tax=Tautonia rosea TaxID=2728037 RepID=UPI001473F7B1|nr:transporter [Tautonia rosea]